MSQRLNKFQGAALLASAAVLAAASAARADVVSLTNADPLNAPVAANSAEIASMDQVTSVSQLSDVKPTDWAFQALQSLVERYGCIAGYPDKTYRGNRALTRYEFAAGLNACLDRVNELIAASTANLAKKEDLATLQKLQEQFATELATLRGRVDVLDTKTQTLQKQQFSTTTKLRGEVIFSVSGLQGGDKAVGANAVRGSAGRLTDESTVFADRVRLSLVTSFTGKDQLLTRLQAKNIPNFGTSAGSNMARLAYEGAGPTDNSVLLDKAYYRFPLGKANITIDAVGGELYNNVPNFNPYLASDSNGSLSRFGRFNPLYRGGSGTFVASGTNGKPSASGAGLTVNYPLGDKVIVSAAYLADDASDPNKISDTANVDPTQRKITSGLFNGSQAILGQIAIKPITGLDVGLTYLRTYDVRGNVGVTGGTGSAYSNQPFTNNVPTSADNYGLEASYKFSPQFTISGWTGWTKAHALKTVGLANKGDNASIFTWAVNLAFPDLGKKGNLAAIILGQPPKVTSNDYGTSNLNNRKDQKSSFHLEGLYRYALTDKIAVTPGLIILFNPEGAKNDTIYVGTIRTTFSF
jgi:Carbohydrate-selective porin, OprB family/S-layer homology domain